MRSAKDSSFFIYQLEQQQIEYDLGSENVLKRMGRVRGDRLSVGQRDYSLVVIPAEMDNIDSPTLTLLTEYVNNGGKVLAFRDKIPCVDGGSSTAADELRSEAKDNWSIAAGPADSIALKFLQNEDFTLTDHSRNGMLYHQRRILDDGQLLFIANCHKTEPAEATVTIRGKFVSRLDPITGKIFRYPLEKVNKGISFRISLAPAGSALFAVTDQKFDEPAIIPDSGEETEIPGTGQITVDRKSDNIMVVDYLDLKTPVSDRKDIFFMDAAIGLFNDYGLEMGNPWQHKIQYRKNYLELDTLFEGIPGFEASYHFKVTGDLDPDAAGQIRAVVERPGLWSVSVNEHDVPATPGKYWIDKDFAVYAVGSYLKHGENTLRLKAPRMHILAEIMPVYLLGDFLVKPSDKGFEITVGKIGSTGSWQEAGMPFYPGKVAYSMSYSVNRDEGAAFKVKLRDWKGVVAEVLVNGRPAGIIAWQPYELDVTEWIQEGQNDIKVTVTGSLKNTFGPFHDHSDDWIIGPHSWIKAPAHQPPGSNYFLSGYGLMEPFSLVTITGRSLPGKGNESFGVN